jgi:hypothetical protein
MKISVLIILFHSIPGLLFMLFAFSMRDEYFFTVYLLTSIVFLLTSIGIGIYHVRGPDDFLKKPTALLFFGMMFSWILALLTLVVLNLTPLCVGQDNGDGMNGFSQCIMYTLLSGGVYTIMILALAAAVAYTGGFVCRRMCLNAAVQ